MEVKIKRLSPDVSLPSYATAGSAGMDLAACLTEPVTVAAGDRALIPTGIALQIPAGYGGFVFPRSGLSMRGGITLCNAVGVIDSDYIGELKIAVHNISKEDYTIQNGDRIAQLVFLPIAVGEWKECDSLEETDRGEGGFGSTGR